jgi:cytoskeletal protein CcmA (bactofilin family)
MWKKEGIPDPAPATRPEYAPTRPEMSASRPEVRPEPPPGTDRAGATRAPRDRATIGRSITIKGEVTGDEDLLIQGRVDGSVNLKQHSVTVGPEGEVKADITGRVVTVEGSVEGNLSADEQVILRNSARVQGDIVAPRLVLEDGARFRGGVDMGETVERSGSRTEAAARGTGAKTAESGRSAPGGGEPAQVEMGASTGQESGSPKKAEGTSPAAAQVTR